MTSYEPRRDGEPVVPAPATNLPTATAAGADVIGVAIADPGFVAPTTKLKKGYITLLILALATLNLAWIAPLSFSLAVRIEQLDAAAKTTALALAVGIPGLVILITGPLLGVISDRTRGRMGRRRPWLLAGAILGVVGSAVTGLAPSVALVIIGWTVAYIGYSTVGAMIGVHLGDRLPESQRGRVAGLSGAVGQIAPIIGVVVAGMFSSMPLAMFLIPAAVAFIGAVVFVLVMKDPPLSEQPEAPNVKMLLQGFWFNPRRHPNLGWVWISRSLIFLSLSIGTIYGVYLLSERLGLDSASVSGIVAIAGISGVAVGATGAILSGWLSDKLNQRKSFLLVSAIMVGAGLGIIATTPNTTQYIVGTLIMVFGIGVYGAVDQALVLDVLPQEEGQNGRYLAIVSLANQIPQAVGPFLAGGAIALFGGDYTWLYFSGAIVAVIGGLVILPVKVVRRAPVQKVESPV